MHCYTCGESVPTRGGGGIQVMYGLGPHITKKGVMCPGGTCLYGKGKPGSDSNEIEWFDDPKWQVGSSEEPNPNPWIKTSEIHGPMIQTDPPDKEKKVVMGDELVERTSIDGSKVQLDISTEACKQFGFYPGELVRDTLGREGIIAGVGRVPGGLPDHCSHAEKGTLWVALDGNGGKVCFYPNPSMDLRKA